MYLLLADDSTCKHNQIVTGSCGVIEQPRQEQWFSGSLGRCLWGKGKAWIWFISKSWDFIHLRLIEIVIIV